MNSKIPIYKNHDSIIGENWPFRDNNPLGRILEMATLDDNHVWKRRVFLCSFTCSFEYWYDLKCQIAFLPSALHPIWDLGHINKTRGPLTPGSVTWSQFCTRKFEAQEILADISHWEKKIWISEKKNLRLSPDLQPFLGSNPPWQWQIFLLVQTWKHYVMIKIWVRIFFMTSVSFLDSSHTLALMKRVIKSETEKFLRIMPSQ